MQEDEFKQVSMTFLLNSGAVIHQPIVGIMVFYNMAEFSWVFHG